MCAMKFNDSREILNTVFNEIRDRNTLMGKDAVPLTSQLFPLLAKKYRLDQSRIPSLMQILKNANMIFSFPVAEILDEGKAYSIEGYVITRGDLILKLRKRYEETFEKLYTDEFQRKMPADKLVTEFANKRQEFNNTPLGITANIVMMLIHYQGVLERNILKYSEKMQEKELASLLPKAGPPESFVLSRGDESEAATSAGASTNASERKFTDDKEPGRRATDTDRGEEMRQIGGTQSIDKTMKMYGIEFYTRVCFREYQFTHMQKIIDDGNITRTSDLKTVKKLLEKERMNSDKDQRINEYAREINDLMKSINGALKRFESKK
jgi:hypothetical protein